jgi:hypothetical protein
LRSIVETIRGVSGRRGAEREEFLRGDLNQQIMERAQRLRRGRAGLSITQSQQLMAQQMQQEQMQVLVAATQTRRRHLGAAAGPGEAEIARSLFQRAGHAGEELNRLMSSFETARRTMGAFSERDIADLSRRLGGASLDTLVGRIGELNNNMAVLSRGNVVTPTLGGGLQLTNERRMRVEEPTTITGRGTGLSRAEMITQEVIIEPEEININVEIPVVMDGREIARVAGPHLLRTVERRGRSAPAGSRRRVAETGVM